MSQGKIFKDGKTIFSESLLKCQYKKNCKDHEIFKVDGGQKLDSRRFLENQEAEIELENLQT